MRWLAVKYAYPHFLKNVSISMSPRIFQEVIPPVFHMPSPNNMWDTWTQIRMYLPLSKRASR